MKKITLLFAIVSLLFSCSNDENNAIQEKKNTAPTAPVLKKQEEVGNVNINFEWSASTDAENDKIVYDIYANNEIVESNISELKYNFLFNEENTKYPIIFKVVAKDIKGNKTDSNEIEIVDPLIGKWFATKVEYVKDDVVIKEEQLSDCEKQSYNEFKDNNSGTLKSFIYFADECTGKTPLSISWSNTGKNNKYNLSFKGNNIDGLIFFGINNKSMYSEDKTNDEQTIIKRYYEKR